MIYIIKEEISTKFKPKDNYSGYYYVLTNYSFECLNYLKINFNYEDYTTQCNFDEKYHYYFFEFFYRDGKDYFRFFTVNNLSPHENQFIIME